MDFNATAFLHLFSVKRQAGTGGFYFGKVLSF
jgi:hypothetical protein